MPPRKKNAVAQVGSDGEQQVEASINHVSMHIEGRESFKEVRQPSYRDLMAAIKDLQRSQAIMWVKFQSLHQKISTPQTPEEG